MRTHRLALVVGAAVGVAACSDRPTPVQPRAEAAGGAAAASAGVIPGRFIVTLREGVSPAAVAREHGVRPDFVYQHALNGFAGAMSDAARDGLLRDGRVARVEPDGIAHTMTTQSPTPSWGLDRIDARSGLSNSYSYTSTGSYTSPGSGVTAYVTAYIIDTGIDINHSDFGGRASVGVDEIGDGRNGSDCNGHGTHVSGTIGGTTYGVAKGVKLVAVRVLDCSGSGTWSGVIAGLDWVVANHGSGPAVANMSLGGGASSSVDDAVRRMISDGVATAVAAGNGNRGGVAQDACKSSPARVAEAMTIGATDKTDTKTSWSNYGSCVDWFAPGSGITSDWLNGGTNTISGTSMATPHTTGVAAQYLARYPADPPATVRDSLYNNLTKGVVKNSKAANNHLLFTNY